MTTPSIPSPRPPADQGDLLDLLQRTENPPTPPAEGSLCPGDVSCPSPIRHKVGMTDAAEKFEAFHLANPAVYAAWLYVSRFTLKRNGSNRLGLSQVMEIVRWRISLQTEADAEFKVSDAAKTFYARLSMIDDPALDGKFVTKIGCPANLWADHQRAYRESLSVRT